MRGRLILAITLVATAARALPPGGETDPRPVDTNPPPVATGDDGGPGETCTSRQDCRTDLRCVADTCRDPREGQSCASTRDCGGELKCIRRACTSLASLLRSSPSPSSRSPSPEANPESTDHDDWLAFDLAGSRAFVGMSWGGGFGTMMSTSSSGTTQGANVSTSFLYALRAGVLVNRVEIGFEAAPMTYLSPAATRCAQNSQFGEGGGQQCFSVNGAVFEAASTVGVWIPLVQKREAGVYFPVRLGIGFIETTAGRAYFQAIGDLIGVNVRVGHLYFGMRLPSFRYAFTPDDARSGPGVHLLSWIFGGDVGYLF